MEPQTHTQHAPQSYRQLADEYRGKALKEPNCLLRAGLETIAQGFEARSYDIERRRAPRTAFGKPGVQISIVGRKPLSACVVDVSQTGACLLFADHVHVPSVFTIEFDDLPRQARVMWRRETFVGVKFTDASPRGAFD